MTEQGSTGAKMKEPDLDALLDDALDEFDEDIQPAITQPTITSTVPSVPSKSQKQKKSLAFDPLSSNKRTDHKSHKPTTTQQQEDTCTASLAQQQDHTEDISADLSAGLSKLFAELANINIAEDDNNTTTLDDDQITQRLLQAMQAAGGAGSSNSSGGGGNNAASMNNDNDEDDSIDASTLAATLHALSSSKAQHSNNIGMNNNHGGGDDLLATLLAQLQHDIDGDNNIGSGDDTTNDTTTTTTTTMDSSTSTMPFDELPGMSGLVDTIMKQLLSKEVLYQPMKDIRDKYPEWLDNNKESLSPTDLQRYQDQYSYIQSICQLYETEPDNFDKLMDLMQKMQQTGQPPEEIASELAPGMNFGADGMPGMPSGDANECCIQ